MEAVETTPDRPSPEAQFWAAPDQALFEQPTLVAVTHFSDAYFERGRWAGFGPRFLKIGRRVRYRKADVVDWINQRAPAASTSELPQPVGAAPRGPRKKPEQPRGDAKKKARAKPAAKRRVASKGRSPRIWV